MSTPTEELAPTTDGTRLRQSGGRAWAWTRSPAEWADTAAGLVWRCHGESDFWRITEGVPSAYDGSALLTRVEGDFELELDAHAEFSDLYDQVGVMIAASETHWLKAGVETDNGFWLSAVYTREESDWSRERWTEPRVELRVVRRAGTIDALIKDSDGWRTFRTLYFDGAVGVGPYSCSPKGGGFDATASQILLTQ